MKRLIATTALALALTAPGYAVLAQGATAPTASPEATAPATGGGVYIAKAEAGDVFGSDFIGKNIYVRGEVKEKAEAADEVAAAKKDATGEVADAKQDASEEVADAQDESAEDKAEANQEATEEVADAKQDAAEDVADAKQDAAEDVADASEDGDWESIGEVSDVVMTRDGDVKAVLVDVGGFLGMGAKTVAITMDDLAWVSEKGDDDPFLTLKSDRAALETAPEFQKRPDDEMQKSEMTPAATPTAAPAAPAATPTGSGMDQAATDAEETDDATTSAAGETRSETPAATAEATPAPSAAPSPTATPSATPNAAPETTAGATTGMTVEAEGYRPAEVASLTAEAVTGATVYDVSNDDIGEVVDLVLSSDGQVEEAIIDVGGFLGLGEHRVAVGADDLKFMQAEDDPQDVRVYVASTKAELKAMPQVEVKG